MKIELGGNVIVREGWQNLDFHTGYNVNVGLLSCYPANSADLVFSAHFVEHLPIARVPLLCADIHRVLKPGGTVRITGPDHDVFMEKYLSGTIAPFYDTFWPDRPPMSDRDLYLNMSGNPDRTKFGIPGGAIEHAWPATASLMMYFMILGGFEPGKIQRSSFGGSRIEELRHSSFDNREDHSFFVEAQK